MEGYFQWIAPLPLFESTEHTGPVCYLRTSSNLLSKRWNLTSLTAPFERGTHRWSCLNRRFVLCEYFSLVGTESCRFGWLDKEWTCPDRPFSICLLNVFCLLFLISLLLLVAFVNVIIESTHRFKFSKNLFLAEEETKTHLLGLLRNLPQQHLSKLRFVNDILSSPINLFCCHLRFCHSTFLEPFHFGFNYLLTKLFCNIETWIEHLQLPYLGKETSHNVNVLIHHAWEQGCFLGVESSG